MNRSRRFTSEKRAKAFAKKLNVEVIDLRDNENRKSDFKVEYTKADVKNTSIEDWD